MMTAPARIPLVTLLRCSGRSFLLQASWNFDRLQNLGFLYQLLPGLRRLYGRQLPAARQPAKCGHVATRRDRDGVTGDDASAQVLIRHRSDSRRHREFLVRGPGLRSR